MHQSLIFNFLVVAPPLSRRGAQKTCGLFLGSSLNTPPDRLIETAKPFFFLWQAVFLYLSSLDVFSLSHFQTPPLTWHHYLDLPGHLT